MSERPWRYTPAPMRPPLKGARRPVAEVIPDPDEPTPAGPFPDPLPGLEPDDEPSHDEQHERLPDPETEVEVG